jgi:hypothetical protein
VTADGHAHEHSELRYVLPGFAPAVFAARAGLRFVPAAQPDAVEAALRTFLAALADKLAAAGCALVGHVKGSLGAPGRGSLAFHLTELGRKPQIAGCLTSAVECATLTVNVIVFGVCEDVLPELVTEAWATLCGVDSEWLS